MYPTKYVRNHVYATTKKIITIYFTEIEAFNYDLLLLDFKKPLNLTRVDFKKNAVFRFIFTETTAKNKADINLLLKTYNYKRMSQENFYTKQMLLKSDDELKNYIENQDHFHEDAILAALLELEKRGVEVEESERIKQTIAEVKTLEKEEEVDTLNFQQNTSNETPELYSTKYILIFGLFTLLGGSILMALNFMQLNNKKAARLVIMASLSYSLASAIILQSLGITNPVMSVVVSILGIYLLYEFIYKKEFPQNITDYKPRNIWIPIIICLAVSLPLLYLLAATGGLPQ